MIISNVIYLRDLKPGDIVYAQDFSTRLILSTKECGDEFFARQIFLSNNEIIGLRVGLHDTFLNRVTIIRQ